MWMCRCGSYSHDWRFRMRMQRSSSETDIFSRDFVRLAKHVQIAGCVQGLPSSDEPHLNPPAARATAQTNPSNRQLVNLAWLSLGDWGQLFAQCHSAGPCLPGKEQQQ